MNFFHAGKYKFSLEDKTYVMGILNVTPDSFFDGGKYSNPQAALSRAVEIQNEGADILDIGAQSTRPGHAEISFEEEWARLGPVLTLLKNHIKIPISIDTFYPEVAEKALNLGADIINDVKGFENLKMLEIAQKRSCCMIVVYNKNGVEARDFFEKRLKQARNLGINDSRICFDPGIGFNKNREDDLYLISNISEIKLKNFPLLMGVSRKRIIKHLSKASSTDELLSGTIAARGVCALTRASAWSAEERQKVFSLDTVRERGYSLTRRGAAKDSACSEQRKGKRSAGSRASRRPCPAGRSRAAPHIAGKAARGRDAREAP